MIHPTAIIDSAAKLDPSVEVGPYAVIDGGVTLGPGCKVGPHCYLTGQTTIGAHNHFFAGSVIGEAPQDLKYDNAPTTLRIGDHNVFRENATVHRATKPDGATVIGSHNFFMAYAHVAHNCQVADHVILATGAMLAGHATVGDRAFLSGSCLVHQGVRLGTLSLMQGGAAISQDLPPYTVVHRVNELCGLNIVGLRRSGLTPAERLELKRLYHLLFRSGRRFREVVAEAQATFSSPPAKVMLDFLAGSRRGVCSDPGRHAGEEESEA